MTLVPNIRVNASAPFPTLVKSSGPVTIIKRNGIWTVGLSTAVLGVLPGAVDPTQVQVNVWNNVSQAWQYTTIAALQSGGLLVTTVTNAMSPYTPKPTDFFLRVDTTGGPVEIDLPLADSRLGVALSIKDWKGNAAVNNITIKPQGAPANETVDNFTNAAPLIINGNFDGVKILPSTGGYMVAP